MTIRSMTIAIAALALGACDNPVTPGAPHEEPAGVAVFMGGTEIARAIDGEVSGALPEVAEGAQSGLLTIVLLDEHGDGLDLSGEDDLYLRVTIEDPAVAEWQGSGYSGFVAGVVEGATTLRFELMHGEPPGGHADFTSMPLDVVVTP